MGAFVVISSNVGQIAVSSQTVLRLGFVVVATFRGNSHLVMNCAMVSSTFLVSAAVFSATMEVSWFMNEHHAGLDFIQNLEWSFTVSVLMFAQFLCVG